MRYFAKIDNNNIVTDVVVFEDVSLIEKGYFGDPTKWIETWKPEAAAQTSGIRGNPANVGSIYDPTLDRFYEKSPFPSWVLDKSSDIWKWVPPIPYPEPGKPYEWDEPTQTWISMGDTCCPDEPSLNQ